MTDPMKQLEETIMEATAPQMPRTDRVKLAISAVEAVDVHTRQHLEAQLLNLLLVARQAKGGSATLDARDIGAVEAARDILLVRAA